jgi:isopenicillin N synthase-like dioxygenase
MCNSDADRPVSSDPVVQNLLDVPYYAAKVVDEQAIPVIDVSELLSATAAESDRLSHVAQQIMEASRRIGFFYIKGHGIAPELIDNVRRVTQDYFALSDDVKAHCKVNTSQRGWMATGVARLEGSKTHDLKEIFFWGPEAWHPRLQKQKASDSLIADNLWPEADFPALRQHLLPYYDATSRVARRLLQAIAVGLNVDPTFFDRRYTSPMARGQLVYYPVSQPDDESAERFGSAPHTDFGVLTLLLQDSNGGLQVKNRQGEWVAAPPIEGTLVCNIGDLLNRWSNEQLSSNLHRVINRSGKKRHSIVVFFDPDPDAVVDPADLGFAEGREKYPAVTASDYIHLKNKRNFNHYRT